MRILFIDDIRTPQFDAVIARSVKDAMPLLDEEWDEIWLDHDLGENQTIRPLVIEMERRAFEGNPVKVGKVFVHSANPVGHRWIRTGLTRYYCLE